MTVDIRATILCDLGEVISGGWSDDHVQGTGLIRTRGELVLKGLVRPTMGQKVSLAYIQDRRAVRFPRSLRVLSAFVDPFRRETTIQLGCLLTLKENYRGRTPQENTAATWDDPVNVGIACTEFEGATISISASYVATKCIAELGLTLSGDLPLTNWYTVEEFDLSAGFVQVLSDLLVSESYVGYLDSNEKLKITSLLKYTGTFTTIKQNRIIDVSAINSGQLPGTAVSVEYSYSRYKRPEDLNVSQQQLRDWEEDRTVGPSEVRTLVFLGGTYTRTVTPVNLTVTRYDSFDRVVSRTETLTTHVAATNPAYLQWHLENPTGFIRDTADTKITTTFYEYETPAGELSAPPTPPPAGGCSIIFGRSRIFDPDRDGVVLRQITIVRESEMAVAGALNIPQYSGEIETSSGGSTQWSYHPTTDPSIVTQVSVVEQETDVESGITKTTETTQQAQAIVQSGQQIGAAEAERLVDFGAVAGVVQRGISLVNVGTRINTRTDRTFGLQRRPSRSERNNNTNRKSFVEAVQNTAFVFGSESVINVVTYSMPYAPDDRIAPSAFGGPRLVSASDAETKARNFGKAQNNLAFGHRNGFSVQLAASDIPTYPLDRIRIDSSGKASGYVCNGTSWSFDSNGIVCSTDALFIGGIGQTQLGGTLG